MSTNSNVTLLLDQVAEGDRSAADELFSIIYHELKQIADRQTKSRRLLFKNEASRLTEMFVSRRARAANRVRRRPIQGCPLQQFRRFGHSTLTV